MTRQDDQPEQIQLTASKDREQQIDALDESDIAALVSFFKLLDDGDRERD